MSQVTPRWLLECTWSRTGRVCHREVIKPKRAARLMSVGAVSFSDGTHMTVHVRRCTFREKVEPILGYIEVFARLDQRQRGENPVVGSISVDDLYPKPVAKTA